MVFSSYTLSESYWSVTAMIGGVSSTVYAAASASTTIQPSVKSVVLVKNVPETVVLTIPDFTSALITDDAVVSFSYDATQMTISAVSCGAVAGVVSVSSNVASVTVTFTASDVPLGSYGALLCSITLTPSLAVPAPVLTNVSVFGKLFSSVSLPSFQDAYVPAVTFSFPVGPVLQGEKMVGVSIVFDQLTTTVGATLTLSSALTGSLFTISECTDATAVGDVITLSKVASAYSCSFTRPGD